MPINELLCLETAEELSDKHVEVNSNTSLLSADAVLISGKGLTSKLVGNSAINFIRKRRTDIEQLLEAGKTVIVLMDNYHHHSGQGYNLEILPEEVFNIIIKHVVLEGNNDCNCKSTLRGLLKIRFYGRYPAAFLCFRW